VTDTLVAVARASGHELRNALNALVVNLEVVRSRISDPATQPFAEQAVRQSEESARLAESAIALLNLVVGAIDADGRFHGSTSDGKARVESAEAEIDRTVRALRALAERGAVRVDTSGPAVILSIPETPESPNSE
jgi:signal transduction histidine kinase